jgi:hypothetical protein
MGIAPFLCRRKIEGTPPGTVEMLAMHGAIASVAAPRALDSRNT